MTTPSVPLAREALGLVLCGVCAVELIALLWVLLP